MGKFGFVHEQHNENVEWYTPPFVFQALGVRFDLDPCSPGVDKSHVPADRHYVLPGNDGLVDPWYGFVWCNPPYGRQTGQWLKRLSDHGNGIALVFSRTGSRWFQDVAGTCSSVVFIAGRVKFVSGATGQQSGNAGADSMLLGWGSQADAALANCNLGVFWRL